MDELKPVARLYDLENGVRSEYQFSRGQRNDLDGWTETPLYGPEALIAIARAMQEKIARQVWANSENCRMDVMIARYGDEATAHARDLLESQSSAILSLDPEALVREYMEKK